MSSHVRQAATGGQPLFQLVGSHLLALRADADLVSSSVEPARWAQPRRSSSKRSLCPRLARAVSAMALSDALVPRIFAYVRQHLTDRDLTPVTIARAHNISVRYLYKLCDAAGVKLVEWIIAERLEGARRDLTSPSRSNRTIASISQQWGFKDPSHFSSRFRNAYGYRRGSCNNVHDGSTAVSSRLARRRNLFGPLFSLRPEVCTHRQLCAGTLGGWISDPSWR